MNSRQFARRAGKMLNFAKRYLRAAALVGHAFTIGILAPRRRHLIAELARRAGHRDYPPARLRTVSANALTSERTEVVLPYPESREGNVSLLELVVLARLVRQRAPAALFEIGTFDGRTTAALAANAPDDARVFTLDLPADHPTRHALAGGERGFVNKPESGRLAHASPWASRITQLYGDSATFDYGPYSADFVFVDGSHAYEYVRSDSERALALLRGGRGLVVWHDYGEWEGVTHALNELQATDPRFRGLMRVEGTTLAILDVG